MSTIIGCDADGCEARYVKRAPGDALRDSAELRGDGWAEGLSYDLCPAHAALLSDDQWRARLALEPAQDFLSVLVPGGTLAAKPIDYAREPQPPPLEGIGTRSPLGVVADVVAPELACDPPLSPDGGPNRVCGYPARDHCAPHSPRHCPGECSG